MKNGGSQGCSPDLATAGGCESEPNKHKIVTMADPKYAGLPGIVSLYGLFLLITALSKWLEGIGSRMIGK